MQSASQAADDSNRNGGQPSLNVQVLGYFAVDVNGARVSDGSWKLKRAKSIVKILAIASDHRVGRDLLLDTLWPDLEPDAALNNLHKAILVARRALEPGLPGSGSFLRFADDILSLVAPGELIVDARRFEVLAADASASGEAAAYEAAIAAYGGQLLPDDLYEDWAISKREELQRTFIRVLSEYARVAESLGLTEKAIGAMQQAVSIEPGLESAHIRLMKLYTAQGDRHRAIRQYQTLVRALKAELGIDPQPETQALYSSIVGGRVALATTTPPGRPPIPAPVRVDRVEFRPSKPLIAGRDAELRQLNPAIKALARGSGGVALISGPAGAGKTRLAEEAASQASANGASVLRGGCYEFERRTPYGPFTEALDGFLDSLPARQRQTIVETAPVDVYPLIPRTAQQMGLRQPMIESRDREFLFAAVETFLRSQAKSSPLVLIIDDLHAADEATLELFHYLARKAGEFPLLMLATFRSEAEGTVRGLSRVLVTLGRAGGAIRVVVGALDREAVGLLLESSLGGQVEAALLDAVYSVSEGNPLFAEETARAMQETGAVTRGQGAWQLVSKLERVPEAVSQLLNDRIDRLTDVGRSLLSVAAVIGTEIPYPLLRRASGATEDTVLDALDELLEKHLLAETGDGYRFTHNLHRAVALESLSRARKLRLHTDVAHAIAGSSSAVDEHAEELAFHFLASNDRHLAIPHLIAAGQRAAALFANDQALDLLGSAHDLLRISADGVSSQEFGTVVEAMGDVHARIGNAARSLELYKEAMRVLEPIDAGAAIKARGKAALAAINAEQVAEGGDLLQSILASISPDSPDQSLSRTYLLLSQLEWHSAQHEGALEAAEKALQAALSSGDQAEAARAYEALALSCHSLGDWQKGIEYELNRAATGVPGFDSDTAFDAHL